MLTSRRAISGSRGAAAVLAGLVIGLLAAVAVPTGAQAAPDAPLTAADRNLLSVVRLAGLWETPAGNLAVKKGGTDRVRKVGAEIAKQHVELDKLVVAAANRLNVQLPGEPNADQRTWLAEMQAAEAGAEFDRVFVGRLRAAHGKVFPVIADVRSGTRNDIVRKLATDANGFVLNHLALLESTGLVQYSDLPQPRDPAPTEDRGWLGNAIVTGSKGSQSVPAGLIWLVLVVALIGGGYAGVKMFRRA
jgi:predicted outer membrane protein